MQTEPATRDDPAPGAVNRSGACTRILPAADLARPDFDAMFVLFATYYEDVTRERFGDDLAAKTHVIQLRVGERIVGFSTVQVQSFDWQGARETSIFSGDTVIDRPWWGSQLLATSFCRLAGRIKGTDPATPLWWFLISKGHRTYRYLNAFAKTFHPDPRSETPAPIRSRIDRLAVARFGADYDRSGGVVRFDRPQGRLKPAWQVAGAARAESAMGRFFEARNPGYARGDELVCLTELAESNLKRVALAAFRDGLRESPDAPDAR